MPNDPAVAVINNARCLTIHRFHLFSLAVPVVRQWNLGNRPSKAAPIDGVVPFAKTKWRSLIKLHQNNAWFLINRSFNRTRVMKALSRSDPQLPMDRNRSMKHTRKRKCIYTSEFCLSGLNNRWLDNVIVFIPKIKIDEGWQWSWITWLWPSFYLDWTKQRLIC